jgi:hypothetical protein
VVRVRLIEREVERELPYDWMRRWVAREIAIATMWSMSRAPITASRVVPLGPSWNSQKSSCRRWSRFSAAFSPCAFFFSCALISVAVEPAGRFSVFRPFDFSAVVPTRVAAVAADDASTVVCVLEAGAGACQSAPVRGRRRFCASSSLAGRLQPCVGIDQQ